MVKIVDRHQFTCYLYMKYSTRRSTLKNVANMLGIGILTGLLGLFFIAVFFLGAAWLSTKNILIQSLVIVFTCILTFWLSRKKKFVSYLIATILFFGAGIYLVMDIISFLAAQRGFLQNKFLSDVHFHFVISFVFAVIFIVMGIDKAIRAKKALIQETIDSTFQN
jgi:uncharacterized membrane protein